MVDANARYRDYRRLELGATVHNYWWGPAFMILDWAGYGLAQPPAGARWIRYYDDALLIDSYGRILDARYGMDWSSFSGWGYDVNSGIPVFANMRTEGYGLDHHAGGYSSQQGGYAQPGVSYPGYGYPSPGYPSAGYPQPGYSYDQSGYGYGQAGGWITETTVTRTCPGPAAVPPPPPPPLPGERG
jgi:hypothetical protein